MCQSLFKGGEFDTSKANDNVAVWETGKDGGMEYKGVVDYCNNWGDMGPVIEASRIYVYPYNKKDWRACITTSKIMLTAMDRTPLRAAVIVYLKMEDEKCGK